MYQAGHPFQQRCSRSAYSHARLKHECPSFLLLLDCVWQILRQFPLALEFSEALLLRLAQEAYASDYGTFLCNNEHERWAELSHTPYRRFIPHILSLSLQINPVSFTRRQQTPHLLTKHTKALLILDFCILIGQNWGCWLIFCYSSSDRSAALNHSFLGFFFIINPLLLFLW